MDFFKKFIISLVIIFLSLNNLYALTATVEGLLVEQNSKGQYVYSEGKHKGKLARKSIVEQNAQGDWVYVKGRHKGGLVKNDTYKKKLAQMQRLLKAGEEIKVKIEPTDEAPQSKATCLEYDESESEEKDPPKPPAPSVIVIKDIEISAESSVISVEAATSPNIDIYFADDTKTNDQEEKNTLAEHSQESMSSHPEEAPVTKDVREQNSNAGTSGDQSIPSTVEPYSSEEATTNLASNSNLEIEVIKPSSPCEADIEVPKIMPENHDFAGSEKDEPRPIDHLTQIKDSIPELSAENFEVATPAENNPLSISEIIFTDNAAPNINDEEKTMLTEHTKSFYASLNSDPEERAFIGDAHEENSHTGISVVQSTSSSMEPLSNAIHLANEEEKPTSNENTVDQNFSDFVAMFKNEEKHSNDNQSSSHEEDLEDIKKIERNDTDFEEPLRVVEHASESAKIIAANADHGVKMVELDDRNEEEAHALKADSPSQSFKKWFYSFELQNHWAYKMLRDNSGRGTKSSALLFVLYIAYQYYTA